MSRVSTVLLAKRRVFELIGYIAYCVAVFCALNGCASISQPLPHRSAADVRPFAQGLIDPSCPGQITYYVETNEGATFFLECK